MQLQKVKCLVKFGQKSIGAFENGGIEHSILRNTCVSGKPEQTATAGMQMNFAVTFSSCAYWEVRDVHPAVLLKLC